MMMAKITTLILGVFACLFGITILIAFKGRGIPLLEVSNVILGMLGTFTGQIFLLGLLTYRTNSKGLITGLIAGTPVLLYTYFWRYLFAAPEERMSFMLISVPPMVVILLVSYITSLLTGKNNPQSSNYVIWSRWRKNTTMSTEK